MPGRVVKAKMATAPPLRRRNELQKLPAGNFSTSAAIGRNRSGSLASDGLDHLGKGSSTKHLPKCERTPRLYRTAILTIFYSIRLNVKNREAYSGDRVASGYLQSDSYSADQSDEESRDMCNFLQL
jgi:hypothetical protein